MTTIVKADKNRLTIRGVTNGAEYLVTKQANGWWIEAAPAARSRKRTVKRATMDLSDHLNALAEEGFSFTPSKKEKIPPCRF